MSTPPLPLTRPPSLAERLQSYLTREHLTTDQLAERLSVSGSAVRCWLTGRRPGPMQHPRLASLLGCTVDDIRVSIPLLLHPRALAQERTTSAWGAWLRGYAKEHQLDVAGLSSLLQVSQDGLRAWLRGQRYPARTRHETLAHLLGVEVGVITRLCVTPTHREAAPFMSVLAQWALAQDPAITSYRMLAHRLDISENTLRAWRFGHVNNPSEVLLAQIAQATGIPLQRLTAHTKRGIATRVRAHPENTQVRTEAHRVGLFI